MFNTVGVACNCTSGIRFFCILCLPLPTPQAAGEMGIAVCNVPGYGVEEVALNRRHHRLLIVNRNYE